jgi:phosphoribosylformimino-5-aminoimidazole carboxamide ribotide isomerase
VKILPVIDLMKGLVVRGVAGRRSEYRPIESRLCDSAEPADVARALVSHFSFDAIYVADLDAIAGAEPAWELYEAIAASGSRLLVDAGLRDLARARELAAFRVSGKPLSGVIAGLESVDSPWLLAEMISMVGADRLIFSLDLRAGTPLTAAAAWQGMTADQIAETAYQCGARRMILLDLADVGVGQGVGTIELCQRLRATAPFRADAGAERVQLIAGGGVRGRPDLDRLSAAGCDAALVASALHDGRLSPADVRAIQGAASE